MTISLFDQFISPSYLGVPLAALAISLPWLILPTPSTRWLNNRLLSLQACFINRFTRQLLLPLNFEGHKWATLLASLIIFLVFLNLLGLLPYTFTPTTQLSLTLGIATPLWLTTLIIGLRKSTNPRPRAPSSRRDPNPPYSCPCRHWNP